MTEKEIRRLIADRTPIMSIIDIFETNSFWEVTGRAGGDVLTYRIYKNNGEMVVR